MQKWKRGNREINSQCPQKLLPADPSWCLVCTTCWALPGGPSQPAVLSVWALVLSFVPAFVSVFAFEFAFFHIFSWTLLSQMSTDDLTRFGWSETSCSIYLRYGDRSAQFREEFLDQILLILRSSSPLHGWWPSVAMVGGGRGKRDRFARKYPWRSSWWWW